MEFANTYEDAQYAAAYARLEFSGTYMLAYRDLPQLFNKHVTGQRALDFGCGAGRSTRFLKGLGFEATGCDISSDMIDLARKADPEGQYVHIPPANFDQFGSGSFDLITAIYPFDNIPTEAEKVKNLTGLKALLRPTGRLVVLVSSSHLYVNEWESFSTQHWPENQHAKSGDEVRIAILNIGDERPVTDILWTEADYLRLFTKSGVKLLETHKPLADGAEPFEWVMETQIAPWEIHVLGLP